RRDSARDPGRAQDEGGLRANPKVLAVMLLAWKFGLRPGRASPRHRSRSNKDHMIGGLDPVKSAVKAAVASPRGWRLASQTSQTGCVVLLYHRVGIAGDPFPNLDISVFRAQM